MKTMTYEQMEKEYCAIEGHQFTKWTRHMSINEEWFRRCKLCGHTQFSEIKPIGVRIMEQVEKSNRK